MLHPERLPGLQARNPTRDLPIAIVTSLAIATTLYVLMSTAIVSWRWGSACLLGLRWLGVKGLGDGGSRPSVKGLSCQGYLPRAVPVICPIAHWQPGRACMYA